MIIDIVILERCRRYIYTEDITRRRPRGEEPKSYLFLNRTLRVTPPGIVCNFDAFVLFSVATPIARPSPIQNGGDVAEADPVSTNFNFYYARYNFITYYLPCPVVLKWDYLSC